MKKTVKCLKLADLPSGDGPWTITEHRLLDEGELLIVLDGCFEVVVDAQTFYVDSWRDGDVVSKEELRRLLEARLVQWAQDKVLNYLSYRPRTESEIRRYLADFELSSAAIERIVSRLTELGLIDDAKFIELWVESRVATNPMGWRRLAAELLQKGIDKSLVTVKLSELAKKYDEQQLAINLAMKQMRRYQKLEEQKRIRKLAEYLQRRGFAFDVIRTAVQTALEGEAGTAVPGDYLDSPWQRE